MNVLITGGAGFIGSHVCERFNHSKKIKKITVIDHLKDGSLKNLKNVINSKKIKFIKCDINNKKKVYSLVKGNDVIIHLAAISDIVPSIENPIDYLNTNFIGTLNLLEAMRKHKVKKIIYAASSSCYGIAKNYPTNENEKIKPKYPYAFSKYIAEELIRHWSMVYKIKFISLRLFNVYGTRSRTNSAYGAALGIFLRQKISKKPFTVVGNGNQKRDFINVKDVAEVFLKSAVSKIQNEIFNVGSGKTASVNEMLKNIKGKKIFIPKRPGEPYITHADIGKIKRKLNWRPKYNLNKGLEEVLENIGHWKSAPLWNKNKIRKATKNWFKYLK